MASIYKRRGSWYVDIRLQGRRHRKRVGKSKHLAQLALKELELKAERNQLGFLDRKEIPITAFLGEFQTYSQANHRPATVSRYRAVVQNFSAFIKKQTKLHRLSQISADTVEKYKIHRRSVPVARNGGDPSRVTSKAVVKGAKGYTVNFELTALRTMFYLAVKWGYLEKNPVTGVRFLKTDDSKTRRFLTEEECRSLLAHSSDEDRPIFFAFLNTGMRRAELVNLEWTDVDPQARTIKIQRKPFWLPKTGEREIPINDQMLLVLNRLSKVSNFVFTGKQGKQLNPDLFRVSLVRTAKRAGISDLTEVHALRHTFASQLFMKGVDAPTVQRLLGHKRIETTMIYTHQTTDHLHNAVSKLRLQPEKPTIDTVRIA